MNDFDDDCDDRPVRDGPTKTENMAKKMGLKMAMVSKMDRSELEDKYIRLYEQYLVIKLHAQKQEERIRRLGILQKKLISDKKKIMDENGMARTKGTVPTDEKVEELQAQIREMERQNGNLKEKMRHMKQQVALAHETRTLHADPRLKTGGGTRQQTMDPKIAKNLRFAGPPSQRSAQGVPPAMLDDARMEIKNRDLLIRELQDAVANYQLENDSLKHQLHAKDNEFEEEILQLKQRSTQDQRANIQENIELIKLQRELREKSSSLTLLHDKYTGLEEKMRLMKASHDQLLNELEIANRSLQAEQAKVVGLQNQLKQSSSSHFASAEREEKVLELERECQILKEANERLLSSAFNLEKEREWRSKEKALKLQIAQLEATLKADVGEKGGILDKLCEQTDRHDQLEEEHRQLRCKYYELKNQYDELADKLKYFSKDSAVNMDELEEALVIVKHRKESQNPELDFLHKVDEEKNKDLDKLVKQLQAEHSDTINELEKTRNMLILQHKINKDYQAEVDSVTRKMEELKRESDLRLNEYAQLLDIRAARIRKLEAQLRDVAYGTRQYRIKPEDTDMLRDEEDMEGSVQLEHGQNLFEIHVTRVNLSSEALKQMNDEQPNIFCTWEFYEFEMQSTPVQKGPKANFEFTSQYTITVDDFFLHYLQKDSCVLELHQSFGTDYQTVAACHLRLHDILEKSQGRLHGTVILTGVSEYDSGLNYGTVDYWVRLRVPMEQALRLYKERSKALGYIESNVSKMTQAMPAPLDDHAAKRAPENINQLHITVIQGHNIKSKRKDVQPSPFCVYKFFDFSDHDTSIVHSSNSPHFDDKCTYPVPMTADFDKYLKTQALKVYVFDDTDPDESSYLGIATVPLIPLAHDKPINGPFEIVTKDGKVVGTIELLMQWQYAYLPPTATGKSLQSSKTSDGQESLPLLPGEEEALRESVVAGGPGTKSGKSLKMSSARTTSGTPAATAAAQSPAKPAVRTAEIPVAKQESPKSDAQVAAAPMAAPRIPSAAVRPSPAPIYNSQSADLDMSLVSEGQHVSGESESVSEASTPRATPSRSLLTDHQSTGVYASMGSDTEHSVSRDRDGVRGEEYEEQDDEDNASEADVVVQSTRNSRNGHPASSANSLTSDCVRVTVSSATIEDNSVLTNPNIKMIYVEYSFIGIPLEETETQALQKLPGKSLNYNFAKVFAVDIKENLKRRQLLASMIVSDAEQNGHDKLAFSLVSEPQEEDDDCVDVGKAYVSMPRILRSGRDLLNEAIPVFDVHDGTRRIGTLTVSVECVLALKAIEKELQA